MPEGSPSQPEGPTAAMSSLTALGPCDPRGIAFGGWGFPLRLISILPWVLEEDTWRSLTCLERSLTRGGATRSLGPSHDRGRAGPEAGPVRACRL